LDDGQLKHAIKKRNIKLIWQIKIIVVHVVNIDHLHYNFNCMYKENKFHNIHNSELFDFGRGQYRLNHL